MLELKYGWHACTHCAEQTGTTGTTIRNVNTTIRKLRITVYGRGKCIVELSLALGWGYI